jgi:hypothetical protein
MKGHHVAQKVLTLLQDDLDGSEAIETITFGIDGSTYEIDLNEKNSAKLRKALDPFVSAGRRVSGSSRRRNGSRASSSKTDVDPAAVRAWAASNGITVSPRGRIAGDVIERFRAAGN